MLSPLLWAFLATLMVPQADICPTFQNGKCEGAAHYFPSSVGSLTFVTQVDGHKPGEVVRHVWRKGNREIMSVSLKLEPGRTQVHSSKPIGAADVGHWTALILAPNGRELRRVYFGIEPVQPPPSKTTGKPLRVPPQPARKNSE